MSGQVLSQYFPTFKSKSTYIKIWIKAFKFKTMVKLLTLIKKIGGEHLMNPRKWFCYPEQWLGITFLSVKMKINLQHTFLFDETLSIPHRLCPFSVTGTFANPNPNSKASIVHDERIFGQKVTLLQGAILYFFYPQCSVL